MTENAKVKVNWIEKSAVQNNPKAITKLGTCYMDGEGVASDIKKAVEELKRNFREKSDGTWVKKLIR